VHLPQRFLDLSIEAFLEFFARHVIRVGPVGVAALEHAFSIAK
jgi:hypothetical protein